MSWMRHVELPAGTAITGLLRRCLGGSRTLRSTSVCSVPTTGSNSSITPVSEASAWWSKQKADYRQVDESTRGIAIWFHVIERHEDCVHYAISGAKFGEPTPGGQEPEHVQQ